MIRIGIYLAIGALCHLVFIGQHFDFYSAWTWLWLFGWPLMIVFVLSVMSVIAAIIFFAVSGIVYMTTGRSLI